MKFKGTISKIDSEGAKGVSDNPLGERPVINDQRYKYYNQSINKTMTDWGLWEGNLNEWKEAEAQRKEYDMSNIEIYLWDDGDNIGKTLKGEFIKVGDRIEGEIINDQIVNVKICG